MSEFGTYHLADLGSRAAWTSAARRLAEAEGIAWTYFELSSEGFGVWDRVAGTWRKPLFDALMTDGPALEPWATCATDSYPAPPPGTCAPSGPLSAQGLPLITDPALAEVNAAPTPIRLDIDVEAPARAAPGEPVDYRAQIGFDLQRLVDETLDRRVRPFIEATYGPALAGTARVAMHLSEIVSTLPAPDGTWIRSAAIVGSSSPVDLNVSDARIELQVGDLAADSRTVTAPLTIDLVASVEPAAGTTAIELRPGMLAFTLELSIGVTFFGSTLDGTLTGPWSCTLGDTPLASTRVEAPTPVATAVVATPKITG